jgi:DNA-directed RNA polymerase specialized sigma24 family protein
MGRLIRAEMRELGLIERTALWLVNVADFTYSEASGVLDLSTIELRGTLLRARRELQARLAIALQGELPGSSRRRGTIGRRT